MDRMLGYLRTGARHRAAQCSLFLVLLTLSYADSLAEEMVVYPDDDPAVANLILLHQAVPFHDYKKERKRRFKELLKGACDPKVKEKGLADDYLYLAAEFAKSMGGGTNPSSTDLYKQVIEDYPDSIKCLQSLPYRCRITPYYGPPHHIVGLPLRKSTFQWHRLNQDAPFVIVEPVTTALKLGSWASSCASEPWRPWEWDGDNIFYFSLSPCVGLRIENAPIDEALRKRLNDELRYKTADYARVILASHGAMTPEEKKLKLPPAEKELKEIIAKYDLRDIVHKASSGDIVEEFKLQVAPSVGAYSALMATYMVEDQWEKVLEIMEELTEIGLGEWLVAVTWWDDRSGRVFVNPHKFNNM